MNTLFQDAPPTEVVGRKLVGRVLLGLLVLAAALVGATAGLLLVYSTDLPQVDELEHYRPGSITELYDDQGRIIGSFALQRRVVASYDDYPQVLRDALISIEDKDFSATGASTSGASRARPIAISSRAGGCRARRLLPCNWRAIFFFRPTDRFIARSRKRCWPSRSSADSPSRRSSLSTPTRFFLGRACTDSRRLRSITSASRRKRSPSMKPRCWPGFPRPRSTIRRSLHPDRALKRRNLVINAMLEDGKITAQQATDAQGKAICN